MTSILGILLGAILFALFAVAGPRDCTGHCAGCSGACGRHKTEGDPHVG